jgi:hypothetical protein
MSKESFSWKSLFVNEETAQDSHPETKVSASANMSDSKFPEISNQSINSTSTNNPFIGEVFDVYQKGFDGLNNEGFDFFELYKSVNAVGVTNPQSYQMAFTMGKTIKSDLTKEFLLEKSKYYISEIEKVYAKFHEKGTTRNKELSTSITNQKNELAKSVSDLEVQITKLQTEMEAKKSELSKIDIANHAQFSEIQLKIEANNIAKQKILESINLVVTGINQYL